MRTSARHIDSFQFALRRGSTLRSETGVTLIELVAAMVVVSLVLAAAFTAMIGTQRASRVNSLVAQTQQNSRIAMEIMARDIKMAGFGMTGAVGACTAAGAPAPLVPNDNNAGGTDTGPDSVSFVVPRTNTALAPFWRLRTAAQGPFTTIELEQAGSVNAMVAETLAVNSTVSIGGAVSGTVAAIDGPNDELTLTSQVGAPKIFPVGTQIFMLECITYQVIAPGDANVALCGGSSPCLVRGFDADRNCNTNPTSCVAIVDGIEDIQLRYACDGCDAAVNGGVADGIPDDTSGNGAFDIADFVSDDAWNAIPMTPDKIRLVRISIVARQTVADQGTSEGGIAAQSSAPVVLPDHNHANGVFAAGDFVAATYAPIRRRVLVRTIQTRNVGP